MGCRGISPWDELTQAHPHSENQGEGVVVTIPHPSVSRHPDVGPRNLTGQAARAGRGAGWAQPAGQRPRQRPSPRLPQRLTSQAWAGQLQISLKNPPCPRGAGWSVLHISTEKKESSLACQFLCFR